VLLITLSGQRVGIMPSGQRFRWRRSPIGWRMPSVRRDRLADIKRTPGSVGTRQARLAICWSAPSAPDRWAGKLAKRARQVQSAPVLRLSDRKVGHRPKATRNNKRIGRQSTHFVMARLVRATNPPNCRDRWPGQAVP
jgi:hypothetical protein